MFRTQGYPYDTGLARRLGDDRAARRARRRRKALAPAGAGVVEGLGAALDPLAVGAPHEHRHR
jgi:hypothetical protein